MAGTSILFGAPAGVPGDVTRVDVSVVEPAMLQPLAGVYAQAFGAPLKYVTGGVAQIAAGDTAASFAGLLVREVPSMSGNTNAGFTGDIPNPLFVQGLLVKGYMAVICTVGTPVRGAPVYMRVVAATSPTRNIGDLEATLDTTAGNNVLLPNVTWASDGKDTNNNAEIRVSR